MMRTRDLADPRSWRAWGGTAFAARFTDPYLQPAPRGGACWAIAPLVGAFDFMNGSLVYSTYLQRFLLVGTGNSGIDGGFYVSASTDLVSWSRPVKIIAGELTYTYSCGDPDPMAYPSLLDPTSTSRNFETVGRTAYLYFTRFRYRDCGQTQHQDLVRVPIEFTLGS